MVTINGPKWALHCAHRDKIGLRCPPVDDNKPGYHRKNNNGLSCACGGAYCPPGAHVSTV